MTGTIDLQLLDPGLLAFKTKAHCRVLIDEMEVGTIGIGDSATFPVAAGSHELRIAMDVGPITRKTRALQVSVADGGTTKVIGKYSRFWGKYAISASS